MEKQKRWQFYLILAVIILTLYNILPTIFYYSKPLHQPVDAPRAKEIALEIVTRVDDLEHDSKEWLTSFCRLLRVTPVSIKVKANDPRLIEVDLKSPEEAALFRRFLPRAGALIPFVPAQLELESSDESTGSKVLVARRTGFTLDPLVVDSLFSYVPRLNEEGLPSDKFKELVYDRAARISAAFGGQNRTSLLLAMLAQSPANADQEEWILALAKDVVEKEQALGAGSPILKRYFNSFAQASTEKESETLVQKYLQRAEALKTKLANEAEALATEQKKLKEKGQSLSTEKQQQLTFLEKQQIVLEKVAAIVRANNESIKKSFQPLTLSEAAKQLAASDKQISKENSLQTISLEGKNPYIQALVIDWTNDAISTRFYQDVQKILSGESRSEASAFLKDQLNTFIINDIARVSQLSDEKINPAGDNYAIELDSLNNTTGALVLNLGYLAQLQNTGLKNQITEEWTPQAQDLHRDVFPVNDYEAFKKLKMEDQKLGLVVYVPAMYKGTLPQGFHEGSIYVMAKGLDPLLQKARQAPEAPESKLLIHDIDRLNALLQQRGFIGYPGSSFGISPEFAKDYIFEWSDYYIFPLKATREDFTVHGSKRFAVLDFSDVEQRILTWNKIHDKIQEDLLKWNEEYYAAQADINVTSHYQVPAPTKNVYWENFKLSFIKYFQGR